MPHHSILAETRQTLDRLRGELLDERGRAAHWTGTLSPSALSTATAVSALAVVRRSAPEAAPETTSARSLEAMIAAGIDSLLDSQNRDGGFGDTDRSYSNIATTMLGIAALRLGTARPHSAVAAAIDRAESYVERAGGIPALRRRYGTDKTFVIPILTNCALAGMVSWREIPALPFEAAAVPQSLYRRMRMPVVSYAIPALVAIGQAHFFHAPPRNPLLAWLRRRLVGRTLEVLERMQPASGGYLEATPLTSFVLMSLASTGRAAHPVSQQAVRFLRESQLEDGSWPIDTNLATWVTSLAVHALASDPEDDAAWADDALLEWLLRCQHTERHPFTGAEPGGWGWTDLSGAVPDGDDTPAAILALAELQKKTPPQSSSGRAAGVRQRVEKASQAGAGWLLQLQNRDGGWPTFCRGWGRLPFDRSSTDLTAHALRALDRLRTLCAPRTLEAGGADLRQAALQRAAARGWRFLRKSQQADGSWLPLWFGNQDNPDDGNPVYGTGRVLLALDPSDSEQRAAGIRAADYLLAAQNADGGWGGGISRTQWLRREEGLDGEAEGVTSSVEETAIALEGLAAFVLSAEGGQAARGQAEAERRGNSGYAAERCSGSSERDANGGGESRYRSAIIRAMTFLCRAVREDRHHNPWPIGFYFAKLWYHERLYPTIFATAALGTASRLLGQPHADPQRDVERA
ncbi:prenyltransferase/squalene oxidase repeat-containing protein [Candidatus Laterigemmans baculatus]|uniref:prenyltransferase/squalene oxidase repeat-containing protein n=1 Tax=Candidatus Laterigemmans baculatus TaxID=2770505 RepID=UPI001F260F96|nr:prenyltransferase/squalene oxidase repeat-containing protein [Candidatus Laterigemmans baculatus]